MASIDALLEDLPDDYLTEDKDEDENEETDQRLSSTPPDFGLDELLLDQVMLGGGPSSGRRSSPIHRSFLLSLGPGINSRGGGFTARYFTKSRRMPPPRASSTCRMPPREGKEMVCCDPRYPLMAVQVRVGQEELRSMPTAKLADGSWNPEATTNRRCSASASRTSLVASTTRCLDSNRTA